MATWRDLKIGIAAFGLCATLAVSTPAAAQPLSTYRWQLEPFCNVISMTVTQTAVAPTVATAVYLLDGFDDQCQGARASIVGSAFFNADGSIGIGLTTVLPPDGRPVHIDARIRLESLGGTWTDSIGNGGALTYLATGSGKSGSVRPLPLPGGFAPGAVGASHVNQSEVQVRVTGSCPAGQAVRSIAPDGGVVCGLNPPTVGGTCAAGHYLRGIGGDGALQCEALPTSNPIVSGSCPGTQVLRGIAPDGSFQCEARLALNETTVVDDPVNQVGSYISIAVPADGLPVISHRDHGANALRVTKCANPACTEGSSLNVDAVMGNFLGYYTSIAIGTDGFPVISHHNLSTGTLRVVKCSTANCSGAVTATVVDGPGDNVGQYSSLAIGADGLPVISYFNSSFGTLRVLKCGNAACSGGNQITTVDDPAAPVGTHTSIAVDGDGLPVIAHYDATAQGLRVTRCGNPACTAGNVSNTVDAPGSVVGQETSIAIGADGLPVISHYNSGTVALRVTKCNNANCTENVSADVDDQANDVGKYTSIAIGDDGRPVISYFDQTAFTLRVLKCGNAACSSGNVAATVDGFPGVGEHSVIAIGKDGLPIVAYQNASINNLRTLKCATPACQ